MSKDDDDSFLARSTRSFQESAEQSGPAASASYTLIGSWVVGDTAAGIGIREDDSLITKDSSRFLPHVVLD